MQVIKFIIRAHIILGVHIHKLKCKYVSLEKIVNSSSIISHTKKKHPASKLRKNSNVLLMKYNGWLKTQNILH